MPTSGTMSKKGKDKITEERLKAGVKISSNEARNLKKKKYKPDFHTSGIVESTSMSQGGMFPSLGDTLYG